MATNRQPMLIALYLPSLPIPALFEKALILQHHMSVLSSHPGEGFVKIYQLLVSLIDFTVLFSILLTSILVLLFPCA